MTTQPPVVAPRAPVDSTQPDEVDPYFLLAQLATSASSTQELCRCALITASEYLNAIYSAIQLQDDEGELIEESQVRGGSIQLWQQFTESVVVECRRAGEAIARAYVDENQQKVAVLAAPLRAQNGAITMVVSFRGQRAMEQDLTELRSLATVLGVFAANIRSSPASLVPTSLSRTLSKALNSSSLSQLAFGIVNSAKREFRCQQAALGMVRGKRVRLVAISGLDYVNPRSPGTRSITQAMEECLDQGTFTCSQPAGRWADGGPLPDLRLHRQWRNSLGDTSVLSIPLAINHQSVAILSLSRSAAQPFTQRQAERFQQAINDCAPALVLCERASRSLAAHVRDRLQSHCRWLLASHAWTRRVAAVLLLVGLAWFCWGSWSYRVSVPFVITPTRVIHFAAPLEGTLSATYVEDGQRVQAGQVLFEMDVSDLELKRYELEAELEVARLESAQHLEAKDFRSAAGAMSQARVIAAHLDTVRLQIQQSRVRAPENGIILSGDIARRVGEVTPLGEPLLQFAPSTAWSIELEVPECDVTQLHEGLIGSFVTTAQPDQRFSFTIDSIQPVAEIRDGQTVFIAATNVRQNPTWMRAGMRGVATVEAGKRRVYWILFHRLINFVQLHRPR
jgi:multidrug resistance efflux pump